MRNVILLTVTIAFSSLITTDAFAQKRQRNLEPIGTSSLQIGEESVVWYAVWKDALAEAKRSQRPIFFMAAACQAGSTSGVF